MARLAVWTEAGTPSPSFLLSAGEGPHRSASCPPAAPTPDTSLPVLTPVSCEEGAALRSLLCPHPLQGLSGPRGHGRGAVTRLSVLVLCLPEASLVPRLKAFSSCSKLLVAGRGPEEGGDMGCGHPGLSALWESLSGGSVAGSCPSLPSPHRGPREAGSCGQSPAGSGLPVVALACAWPCL